MTPKEITFGMIETFTTSVWYEPITINVEDYTELEGMTEEQIKEYLTENYWDMKPSEESDWAESLADELLGDVIKDKIYDNEKELFFE